MSRFSIRSNPENFGVTWTSPLWWTSDNRVAGQARTDLHAHFHTRMEAEEAFSEIPPESVRFYDLVVVEERRAKAYAGGNGWMRGHPGYDLMY